MSLHPLRMVYPPDIPLLQIWCVEILIFLESIFLDPAGFYIYNFISYFRDILSSLSFICFFPTFFMCVLFTVLRYLYVVLSMLLAVWLNILIKKTKLNWIELYYINTLQLLRLHTCMSESFILVHFFFVKVHESSKFCPVLGHCSSCLFPSLRNFCFLDTVWTVYHLAIYM